MTKNNLQTENQDKKADNQISRSRATAAKVFLAALKALKDAGGSLSAKEVLGEVEKSVHFDEWEREIYKGGGIRWKLFLNFYSSGGVKAGLIRKQKGTWIITQEGEKALSYSPKQIVDLIDKKYREWKELKEKQAIVDEELNDQISDMDSSDISYQSKLEEAESIAIESLKNHIATKTPYEFQDLVAALMRGMGYYTPFIAPRGKDGGVDLIAYKDPLGTLTPRIKVQVKHRNQRASVEELRQLIGLIQRESEVGIFVSTGGFTNDCRSAARNSAVHVELIDIDKFISLWQEFYYKLNDEDKLLMPLYTVYFLAPKE